MAAHMDPTTLVSGVELPEVGGLPHNKRALCEGREEGKRGRPAIRAEVWIAPPLAKVVPQSHGHHLDIAHQGGCPRIKTSSSFRNVL